MVPSSIGISIMLRIDVLIILQTIMPIIDPRKLEAMIMKMASYIKIEQIYSLFKPTHLRIFISDALSRILLLKITYSKKNASKITIPLTI